ncbi:MAG: glycine zipper domain-containing protein [Akkermansiaceae bacterium]
MKMMKLFRQLSMPTAALTLMTMLVSSCGDVADGIGSIGGGGQVGELAYDSQERKILGQARGVGTAVGATAGYFIAKNNGMGSGVGALLGAALGAAAGDAIGKNQANKARQKRLDNNTLRGMIASARKNNARLAAYNRKVARRIAQIRSASRAERASLAKSERISVDRAIKKTDQMIQQRQSTSAKLAGSQRAQLDREIRIAKSERATLARHRSTLASYSSVASR